MLSIPRRKQSESLSARNSAEPLSFKINQIDTFPRFEHAFFASLKECNISKMND